MPPPRGRQDAAEIFWDGVEDLLVHEHNHSTGVARQGIDDYRRRAVGRLGEVVYNQGEELVARVIDGIIKHGFPTPDQDVAVYD